MTRHRFEPARLAMGLLLCGAAVVYLLDGLGVIDVHPAPLALMVPATLMLGAVVAVTTVLLRHARTRRARTRRRRAGAPAPD
ncbi:hypothetical protein E4198_09340 [Streptomyces sp. RKND-216]|uniref:hypothetical protein n=1 Tax=Streptomyces sp. RKND-216 TaxID=2562581 RepID=UPI00109DB2DC|nr:hypothetical protein [Streptomyces sp. RKND-216]THA24904.1 hypothetical protein E4198_09340 [Streptomyces sp. RKND-216]